MFNVILLEKVKNDLKSIVDYISEDSPLYSIKTVKSIMKSVYMLEDFPYLGKEISNNIRKLVETNYRYNIIYKIDGNNIYILAIFKYKNNWE